VSFGRHDEVNLKSRRSFGNRGLDIFLSRPVLGLRRSEECIFAAEFFDEPIASSASAGARD
jgi:hypothetical protein